MKSDLTRARSILQRASAFERKRFTDRQADRLMLVSAVAGLAIGVATFPVLHAILAVLAS